MTAAFAGETIALLTQHGKERAIAPVLEPALACRVARVDGFDTDSLGTFTRDVPRPGTQLEAARRKARIGMELSGRAIGLASEGSFGPDPITGMLPWNREMVVLIDGRTDLEVVGFAQGPGQSAHLLTDDWAELEAFARRLEFPEHHLVVRPHGPDDPRLRKGIADRATLARAFDVCRAESADGRVFVEADLRAFANPTRMRRIAEATEDLLRRLRSACPACARPGYWIVEREPGLPCSACGHPTQSYRIEVWGCAGCAQREARPRTDRSFAEPQHCDRCNP